MIYKKFHVCPHLNTGEASNIALGRASVDFTLIVNNHLASQEGKFKTLSIMLCSHSSKCRHKKKLLIQGM